MLNFLIKSTAIAFASYLVIIILLLAKQPHQNKFAKTNLTGPKEINELIFSSKFAGNWTLASLTNSFPVHSSGTARAYFNGYNLRNTSRNSKSTGKSNFNLLKLKLFDPRYLDDGFLIVNTDTKNMSTKDPLSFSLALQNESKIFDVYYRKSGENNFPFNEPDYTGHFKIISENDNKSIELSDFYSGKICLSGTLIGKNAPSFDFTLKFDGQNKYIVILSFFAILHSVYFLNTIGLLKIMKNAKTQKFQLEQISLISLLACSIWSTIYTAVAFDNDFYIGSPVHFIVDYFFWVYKGILLLILIFKIFEAREKEKISELCTFAQGIFYFFRLAFCVFLFAILEIAAYKERFSEWFVILLSLSFVPQIMLAVKSAGPYKFNIWLTVFNGLINFCPSIYFLMAENNIAMVKPRPFCAILAAFIFVGLTAILLGQQFLDKRFFFPIGYLSKEQKKENPNEGKKGQVENSQSSEQVLISHEKSQNENMCNICFMSLEKLNESGEAKISESDESGHEATERDGIVSTSCGHQFHRNCLNVWLMSNQSCPNCQREVPFNYLD